MDVDERPLRVMADANIIIAGVFKPRWFFEFLGHALRGDFQTDFIPTSNPKIVEQKDAQPIEGRVCVLSLDDSKRAAARKIDLKETSCDHC